MTLNQDYHNNGEYNHFRLPAEWEQHNGTIMIWPYRKGSFGLNQAKVKQEFINIIKTIAEDEPVYLVARNEDMAEIISHHLNVKIIGGYTNDAWARDTMPIFLKSDNDIIGLDFGFNAWGGSYNGLYSDYDKDNKIAEKLLDSLNIKGINNKDFILEGGSIHSDGEGTLMVTESCLLSKGRNPHLSKIQIEEILKSRLNIEKVLWLPRGIYNDDTDEHVDNIAAFIAPANVVLAYTDDKNDPQYQLSMRTLKYLSEHKDAHSRNIKVHLIPIPTRPITVSGADVNNMEFESDEVKLEVGERLPASYINFYITNKKVLVPEFGGENEESDKKAANILQQLMPDRRVIQTKSIELLKGGGNIHCLTMQVPRP